MRFFTADSHINHYNMHIYEARPPYADQLIVDNWNKQVEDEDEIRVMGDFIWTRVSYWLPQLRGKIYVIMGNHDFGRPYGKYGVRTYREPMGIDIDGQYVILSHRPVYQTKRWNLHGHVHGWWKQYDNKVNVGVDVRKYRLVTEEEIIAIMRRGPVKEDFWSTDPREYQTKEEETNVTGETRNTND